MSGDSVLLDTNVVQFLLNGDDDLEALLDGATVYISVITKVELLCRRDLDDRGERIIRSFLGQVKLMEFSNIIQDGTVRLRRSQRIKLPDAIIAATAVFLDVPLITADTRFTRIKEGPAVFLVRR